MSVVEHDHSCVTLFGMARQHLTIRISDQGRQALGDLLADFPDLTLADVVRATLAVGLAHPAAIRDRLDATLNAI